MKARLSNARISPKKMNLIAGLVRGMTVSEALTTLEFANKKAANMLHKLLTSALSNAVHNFNQSESQLMIDEIKVSKGSTLKRFRPVSRGRAHKINKVNSHVTITLKAITGEKPTKKVASKDAETKATAPKAKAATAKKTTTKASSKKAAPKK